MKEVTKNKKLIIFDLDRTLAKSKSPVDSEMADLLGKLLLKYKVAIISGGAYPQFEKQLLGSLDLPSEALPDLYLLPTSGTALFEYKGDWKKLYEEKLSEEERKKIKDAFIEVFEKTNFVQPDKLYGEQIEDRGTQITFSALGQDAPLSEKKLWDPDLSKRRVLQGELEKIIPEFEVQIGGSTSIDVTKKGSDKAHGILELSKHLDIPLGDMLFVGDRLLKGGNDYSVTKIGVDWIEVADPEEAKDVIRNLIS